MLKVIIAGSRNFNDYEFLKTKCDKILERYNKDNVFVMVGCAKGVDTMAFNYCLERGYEVEVHRANWGDFYKKPSHEIGTTKYGDQYWKLAGLMRNQEMVDKADALIAFWYEKSNGTKDVIERAKRKNIPVRIIKC